MRQERAQINVITSVCSVIASLAVLTLLNALIGSKVAAVLALRFSNDLAENADSDEAARVKRDNAARDSGMMPPGWRRNRRSRRHHRRHREWPCRAACRRSRAH